MPERIDLDQYYTAKEAAAVLTKNSGKTIDASYVRMLAKYGKLTPKSIHSHLNLYPKVEVDAYVVEDRGEKSARAAKAKAQKEREGK